MGTQIGPDGERYPIGSVPTTYIPRNTKNRLTAVEGTTIQAISQGNSEMVAGTGYADGESSFVCGMVIPDTWTTFSISCLWGIWGNPGTLGDISWAVLSDQGVVGGALPNPVFTGAVTVSDISIGIMNETVLAENVVVDGDLLSIHVNRAPNLMGQAFDAELGPYAAADTSTINAATGGLFAVIVTPTNIMILPPREISL